MAPGGGQVRLKLWCGIVAVACAGGAAFGWAIGGTLAWVSGDYVASPALFVSLGLRAGLFAGAILAGCNVITTSRPLNRPGEIARALMLSGMVAASLVCAGATAGLLIPYVQDLTAAGYSLGHPHRYAVFLAMDRCWLAAIILGAIVGSAWSWRQRGAQNAVRESQPKQEVDRK